MAYLGEVAWPPAPIRTERLVLRPTEPRDRASFIDLLASEEVHRYLGGAQSRDQLEAGVPAVPGDRPGVFAVDDDGGFVGTVTIDRREGDVERGPGELEIGYLFLPQAWGQGYAAEACAAALDWCSEVLPGEPVVLFTQTANAASVRVAEKLGFAGIERFEAWGAEQWFAVRR